MEKEQIRAGVVQFEHADGDKEANLATIADFVDRAAVAGVQLLVFPECCVTGYWFLRNWSRETISAVLSSWTSSSFSAGPSMSWSLGIATSRF